MIEFIEHHKRFNFLFGDFSLVLLLLPPLFGDYSLVRLLLLPLFGRYSLVLLLLPLSIRGLVWYYYLKLPLFGDYSMVLLRLPPSREEGPFPLRTHGYPPHPWREWCTKYRKKLSIVLYFVRILPRYKFRFVTSVADNSSHLCLLDLGLDVCRSCIPN